MFDDPDTVQKSGDNTKELTTFLREPGVIHVLANCGEVRGITVLGTDVFVVRDTPDVDVYNSTSFTTRRMISIPKSEQLGAIVSCSHNNCLYVIDSGQKIIYRYDLSNNVTTKWSVSGTCYKLSVTKCYNVLTTSYNTKQIQEYTTDGSLIREISLNSSIDCLYHCVSLSTGNFVVSQTGRRHLVCIVDINGHIIQSYGGPRGSGVGQLNHPRHLVVDIDDNVLVADSRHHRVQLLSHTLTYLGDIVIPGHQLNYPHSLHFDELNHRLYIGEWGGKRVFVLDDSRLI